MRSFSERLEVDKLIARGASDYAIAAITGVPRGTVANWRRHPDRGPREVEPPERWRPSDPAAYAYLLGLCLGDGCLSPAGSPLMIALDARYPGIVDSAQAAIERVVSGFPQHGPGRKHLRRIELVDWQIDVTHAYPQDLLRGLIHSDGCRTTNRFKVELPSGRVGEYEYPRYFFSNLSDDIRRIFCDHCELLGIRWTQSNPRNISISYRKSVARLDEFVGPKW